MAVTYIRSDLEFILRQILIAEQHAAGADLASLLPNSLVPFGLRTIDGSFNNLIEGQSEFGSADNLFPRLTDPIFRDAEAGTSYQQTTGTVIDSQPRTISNLIVDQTSNNPAAVAVAGSAGDDGIWGTPDDVLNDGVSIIRTTAGADGILGDDPNTLVNEGADDIAQFSFDNVAPDAGLSAPFNLWFVFFGQFFDHGLDLVQKGGNDVVFVPLQPDDPLITLGPDGAAGTGDELTNPALQFMVLTRATQFEGPGADGILVDDPTTAANEAADNTSHEALNQTSPFVDQNQTYTSTPSHQVFLREYQFNAEGRPVATGKLITNRDLVDGEFGNGNDVEIGGMSTWAVVKAQARDMLGIQLTDHDVANIPLVKVDPYGNFIPGPNGGFAQIITDLGPDGIPQTADDLVIEGDPLANGGLGVSIPLTAPRTGQSFLLDIAHSANPFNSQTGAPLTQVDADLVAGVDDLDPATYDDELLAEHFIAGDGRVNENIALTAVHHVFHAEHNRLVDHTKQVILSDAQALLAGGATQAEAVAFLNSWLLSPVTEVPANPATLVWDGERLFQAAKFGTEMQYQHLVFEEFARKIQPQVDVFLAPAGFDTTIDAAIVAEFAHTVYRFGHSMLLDQIDRLSPDFVSSEIGLIDAFLNPLEFDQNDTLSAEEAAGAIIRGTTRQIGNAIDEFKTEALRNNLLGLPLDLASINLARGRDTGIPSLNAARAEFFEMTGDSQLTPYTSWVDFSQHIKHPESLVNFIAAYGTHSSITGQSTLAGKRAAAMAIVFGVDQIIDPDGIPGNGDEITFVVPADSLEFLNSTGAWANGAGLPLDVDGVTTTGLGNIDLWIGGLAEETMPFGGFLGSTFNFVFENQLENLQDGDRLYYLARLAGLNFLNELENNSFAKLIMANTDTTHLPGDVFSTPGFILEVDPTRQFTGLNEPGPDGVQGDDPSTPLVDEGADDEVGADGIAGNSDPFSGDELEPEVIRDNPATPGLDTNFLQYTGDQHVVLGGTDLDDILIASEGDDTLYGDGGNDRLEGGYGNDMIIGGAGDDIMTDIGGDDNLQGEDGNDVMQGGQGFNLFLGGRGSDFIITGEDVSEVFAGEGNDFIFGAKTNLINAGNEGDDWIELGTQDGAPGDNFDPQIQDPVIGNDVLIGGGGFDEFIGEGGDDIMVGGEGEDHFDGGSGFDWGTYKDDRFGVTVDMLVSDLFEPPVAPSNAGILDRFAFTEGLSGSAFGDFLRGDDAEAADIADTAGAEGSVLTNIALIDGLQELLDTSFGTPQTSFGSGNIILGGSGSDIIEGRGGDDLLDGDQWLNVRVSVRAGIDPVTGLPTGAEIATFDSIADMIPFMLDGTYNPGQLQIVREILTGTADFDTANFSDVAANYSIVTGDAGVTTVTHLVPPVGGLISDGVDRLTNIERLQFADQSITIAGVNNDPVGQLVILDAGGNPDNTPAEGQLLRASIAGVTDDDNPGTGAITGPVAYHWQVEARPGTGIFEDIRAEVRGNEPARAEGATFVVTPDLVGLSIRVRAVYQDANGVLEQVFSPATAAVEDVVLPPPTPVPATPDGSTVPTDGLRLIATDLAFILDQIKIAEQHAAGAELLDIIPNSRVAFGLRTIDGSFNNLVNIGNTDQTEFGASDNVFPRLLDPFFRNDQDGDAIALGPPPAPVVTNTDFSQSGDVVDADPRIISNLIVDQTSRNPAAVAVAGSPGADGVWGTPDDELNDGVSILRVRTGQDAILGTPDDIADFSFENVAPDGGLSAPFNLWFVFFGQFFDHGLDLVAKGGSGTVFIPLQPDDPLIAGADTVLGDNPDTPVDESLDDLPPHLQFMVLTRATNQPGPDGILGDNPLTPLVDEGADDIHEHTNLTSPFVDQNQTYTSTPSHQVFLRAYELDADGEPVATGRLITNRDLGADGQFGTPDDVELGGMSTWGVVKAQARDLLGIELSDYDAVNVPMIKVDPYGNFIPGEQGFAQLVLDLGPDGLLGTDDDVTVEGNPAAPVSPLAVGALRTGHPFLADIAHSANPFSSQDNTALTADADNVIGDDLDPDTYDDELLAEHFMAGDGRVNENIGLTTVHHVFHAEHNRLVELTKAVLLDTASTGDVSFLNEWLLVPVAEVPADLSTLVWNGERLFQAAKFGTEMQYQHLVFEEFARTIQPNIDVFFATTQVYDSDINPAIVAEFAHTVYRFGHSMLLDEVDRFDPTFQQDTGLGLIEAFLNPLAFDLNGTLTAEEAAGAIVRGTTRQAGNEIDEFKTEALRNNLLGLPLDLATINLARGRETGIPSLQAARADFYAGTGDNRLAPYTSWVDFSHHLRHPESLVNFIAAYGTHASITAEATLEGKRAAALAIVLGGVGAPADRLDFLHATGAFAGGSLGGLNDVDFWIGGLAEEQMPFGGFLGSTFNFVFEEQLEKLQDGDRFYYLERTAGMNFLSELENNSFAKMIMANTDATHLPGLAFLTPGFTLEVNQAVQFTGLNEPGPDGIQGDDPTTPLVDEGADDEPGLDGIDGNSDPLGDVIRDNPATPGVDTTFLQYTGDQHVVLGGTDAADTIISSEGDDTLYGDGGDDRLEGGFGNDTLLGGVGDDILVDAGGDDLLQGQDGNDVLHGGQGVNLLIGGFGNDFIVNNEDIGEIIGGAGNDFILGNKVNEEGFGNEGDDWIQFGSTDGFSADNADPFARDQIVGNDVYFGDSASDRMDGEGGDDILVGNHGGGEGDRYLGKSGFDWAVFKDDPSGVTIDMNIRAFDETIVPRSNAAINARFESTEGLSGSQHADILQGDDLDAAAIATSGFTGSVLTNFALIDGLQDFVGAGVTSFGAGNIILGGEGSDIIEGRGGDDLIDGDQWLNVRIGVFANLDGTGAEIDSYDSMEPLVPLMVNGTYNPGQLRIVREILPGDAGAVDNFDTVFFSGLRDDYIIDIDANGTVGDPTDDIVTVTDNGVSGILDGTDRLTNVERLQFSDQSVVLVPGVNEEPVGLLTIDNDTPLEGETLTVSIADVTDADNVTPDNPTGAVTGPVSFFWQVEEDPGSGRFTTILIDNVGGELVRATGSTFIVPATVAGQALRVMAVYKDANGVLETVFSAPTTPVDNINDLPTVGPTISDPTPTEGLVLTAVTSTIVDPDGTADAIAGGLFTFQWEQSTNGTTWTNATDDLGGGTAQLFVPNQTHVGLMLRVAVTFTDDGGTTETVISAATQPVADDFTNIVGTEGPDILTGTDGFNVLFGLGGDDTLLALGGDDQISGGEGNDLLDGGSGADFLEGGLGDDTYVVDDAGDFLQEFAGEGTDTVLTSLGSYALGPAAGPFDVGHVENLTYTGTGDFTGTGNELDNAITGNVGADTLSGGLGNDRLDGAGGADAMTGGAGNDTYVVDNAGDQAIEGAGGGTDTVHTVLGAYTLGANVENLVYDGAGGFAGTGNTLDNAITGNGGVDWLDGGDGADWLDGGAGNDTLVGAVGNDTLVGAGGADWLDGGDGVDWLDGGADNDTLVGVAGNDTLVGAGGNDWLDGGAGADWLDGGADNDTLVGAADNDTLIGAGGNDWLDGGAGADWLDGGADNDTLVGAIGNDTLVGAGGTDWLDAGVGADWLDGGAGNDVLLGGQGNDVLVGAAGADFLDGGAGDDILVFAPGFGNDVVDGFDANPGGGQDRLDLTALGITAATFAASVTIADIGAHMVVTIGADSITLLGVNGNGQNTITQQDFILA